MSFYTDELQRRQQVLLHELEDAAGIVRDEQPDEWEPDHGRDTWLVLLAAALGLVVLGNLVLIALRLGGL